MCGLTGFFGGTPSFGLVNEISTLQRMRDVIAHRGPDDAGLWHNEEQRIWMAHRRLSIVDLSPAGHQPMRSASQRFTIVFNGEIYNHTALRATLESQGISPAWRGHSDTETLLAGFDAWGIENTIERSIGMFAFAVWDMQERVLTLARDRVGEKPMYYGWQGCGDDSVFLFGSELKSLRVHPAFNAAVSRGALSMQMRHNYIPAPLSIYEGIAKLPAGCLLTVSLARREPEVHTYWSGIEVARSGTALPFEGTEEEAVDTLEKLLKEAVKGQMMSDVPLGAFLSGGIDSSTVVSLMQAQSSRPVKTFSIGFHEKGYDEAQYAKAVAKHLGTEHTELYVTSSQALAVIPRLPEIYDEPFSDPSQIPTFLVSQLARQHVAVSLSGDAGDELFGGYERYRLTANMWRKMATAPLPLRRLAARGLTSISPQVWDRMAQTMRNFLPHSMHFANFGDKIHKGADALEAKSVDALYERLASHWHDPASLVIGGSDFYGMHVEKVGVAGLDPISRMMALDMLTYLPDDILVKVDRAAMNVSLETRVPFLDHRVVEFAWRLPQSLKLREGQTKWVLRQVLYRHLPRDMIERPKMGFGVPIGEWLRGPLREWAEELIDESRLRNEGYFKPAPIRKKWSEHLSGRRNWAYYLWDVLMFQAWHEAQAQAQADAYRATPASARTNRILLQPI